MAQLVLPTNRVRSLNIEIEGYDKQLEFIKSTEYITGFIGGVGSGKTHCGAQKALAYCLEHPGCWGVVTAPTYQLLEEATLPKFFEVFPRELIRHAVRKPHPKWELHNGCRILFWSTDKPWTIAGFEAAWAFMDEVARSPYEAFFAIKERLRQPNPNGKPFPFQLWLTTTPRQLNWIYAEFGKDLKPDHKLIRATTKENIYLDSPEEYIERLGLDPKSKTYRQEIEGLFVSLAGECLFSDEVLDRQEQNCYPSSDREDEGYTLIWKDPIVGAQYIAAADCADEGGGGANCLIIADRITGEQMLETHADIRADKFAQLCFNNCTKYNNARLAPERNGTGNIVIDKLTQLEYPNLYKEKTGDKSIQRAGWYTSVRASPPRVTRETMLLELEEAVRTRQLVIHCREDIDEMRTFVRNEKDKYVHLPHCMDDRVMTWAILNQLKKEKPRTSIGFMSIARRGTPYDGFVSPFIGA